MSSRQGLLQRRLRKLARTLASPERQDGYGRTVLPGALLMIVLLLVFATATIVRSVDVERSAREQSQYASGIIQRLNQLLLMVVDGETGQRGYLLTGDRRYLAPYRAARATYPEALDRLRTFVYDEGGDQQRRWLATIQQLTEQHFQDLETTVSEARAGNRDGAIAAIMTDVQKRRTDALRSVIARYIDYENSRLAQRLTEAGRYERRGSTQLWVVAVLIAALLGFLGYLMTRNLRLLKTESELIEITRAKEQVELISRELNHRVKNLFAIVMAIVTMTARRESNAQAAAAKARERISALAAAHQLTLERNRVGGISIQALVDTVLAPYASDRLRFTARGPAVNLPSRMATPVGLALHELATNAVKYGSWSTEAGGSIAVDWQIAPGEDPGTVHLTLSWAESGGPEVNAPDKARSGFGSLMIDQGMRQIRGSFHAEWRPTGVVATMRFDVPAEPAGIDCIEAA